MGTKEYYSFAITAHGSQDTLPILYCFWMCSMDPPTDIHDEYFNLWQILEQNGTVTREQSENHFTINGKGFITAYTGQDLSLTIPDRVCGIPVTGIKGGVFQNKNLTNVIIPEGVTYIGLYAFFGNKLTSIIAS